jgi:hypothetical protein
MFSYGLKKEYKSKKVDVTYYRMHYNDVISNIFTKYAREKLYFLNEDNNKLYYLVNGKKVVVPFTYNNDLFSKCVLALYPIGTIISDKTDANKNGEVLYYIMECNKYVVRNGSNNMSIHFDNAIVNDYYYFISSVGKVQRDIVGRDLNVDTFRKKANNYFETKEEANNKLNEINLLISK